jgi:hypothetical protein
MKHPTPRELSPPQLSLWDFFDQRNGCNEVLHDCPGTGKEIFSEKCLSLWTQDQAWSTGRWKVHGGDFTASEPLKPDFDLGPAVSIVAECAR